MNSTIVELLREHFSRSLRPGHVPANCSHTKSRRAADSWVMRMHRGARMLVFFATIGTASQLAAQPAQASPPDRTEREMALQAKAMNGRVTAHVMRAHRLRERTGAKDMIRLSCINDGMVALLLNARISEAAFAAFNVAVSANDHEAVLARFTALTRATDAADAASQELRGCIGSHQVEVHHQPFGSNPTDDCNALGQWSCASQPLEYVGLASPFTPR